MSSKPKQSDKPQDRPSTDTGGPNVLLGVTGGIAAYKAVDLAGKLTAAGATVKTVMTQNACRFVTPLSFEVITGCPVFTNLWDAPKQDNVTHIAFVDWADIVVVAPATANTIAKAANGICDDLLSTVLCACWSKPTLFAPAMNNNMWENPAVQANIDKIIKTMAAEIIGPATGRLACGTHAIGRMAEPQDILDAVNAIAERIGTNT
jgi:phosphopantothenoylcysteine decarboxylase/phosphopantothenate--cysteine ligase